MINKEFLDNLINKCWNKIKIDSKELWKTSEIFNK